MEECSFATADCLLPTHPQLDFLTQVEIQCFCLAVWREIFLACPGQEMKTGQGLFTHMSEKPYYATEMILFNEKYLISYLSQFKRFRIYFNQIFDD